MECFAGILRGQHSAATLADHGAKHFQGGKGATADVKAQMESITEEKPSMYLDLKTFQFNSIQFNTMIA